MARRRTFRRGASKTRLMEWSALAEVTTTATAASVVRSLTLLGGQDPKATVYRILGDVVMLGTADANMIYHLGVYRATENTGGGIQLLDPSLSADVAREDWLWWRSGFIPGSAGRRSGNEIFPLKFDIKVKRILGSDQSIVFVMHSDIAYTSLINARMLIKATGTR